MIQVQVSTIVPGRNKWPQTGMRDEQIVDVALRINKDEFLKSAQTLIVKIR
jgi:hypothetical protein